MNEVKVSCKKTKDGAIVGYYIKVSEFNIFEALDNCIIRKLKKLTNDAIQDYFEDIIDERIIKNIKERHNVQKKRVKARD